MKGGSLSALSVFSASLPVEEKRKRLAKPSLTSLVPMDESQLRVIAEIGSTLVKLPRRNKDSLTKTLKQASNTLSQIEQPSPSQNARNKGDFKKLVDATKDLRSFIVNTGLSSHGDKEVRLLVAACVSELFRILAPEPPFEDKYLKDIFRLIFSVFKELPDTRNTYFSWRVKILETIARCKCCVVMLDIDCNDLVLEMFDIFFSIVRDNHQQSLINDISSIMIDILSEEASHQLLEIILRNLLKESEDGSSVASQLAISIIKSCPEKLKPFLFGFLSSCSLDRDAITSELKEFYHDIVLKIFQYSPEMLHAVIPNLIQELLADQVDVRIKAVNLMGKLFSLPEYRVAQIYHHLFMEYVKRFTDISAEVRVAAIHCAKACYLANPLGTESNEVLTALEGRLLDFDDKVRMHALTVACDVAKSHLRHVPLKLISEATERLRDKKISIRKKALKKLMEVYRAYCEKVAQGHMTTCDHFEQIPCKVLMLCYDRDCKEFRTQSLDTIFYEELFPTCLPFKERIRHWVHLFSLFNSYHLKALNSILSQKRRLRTEMKSYLSLRKKDEENNSEDMQKRIDSSFAKMSACFPDPLKAEECFHKLNQTKDNNIFNELELLLDEGNALEVLIEENNTSPQASRHPKKSPQDRFLEVIGDKHPQFDFFQLLSSKCLLNIFNSQHVHCILDYISSNALEKHLVAVSVELFLVVISNFPSLLKGSEAKFRLLLEESYLTNDKLIQILEKAGSHISVKFSEFYPFLKKICLEGNRSQSKHAVAAIAALIDTSEHFDSLDLCKDLVISLHSGKNIPAVLQSLGCIAQHFVLAFEAHDAQITPYIYKNIFQANTSDDSASTEGSSGCSASCKLKIYGLKTLIRSFLPHSGLNVNRQITKLWDVLLKMMQKGGQVNGIILSEIDKAHVRLAAAKSVLRLSRRWDLHIPAIVFRFTILTAKDSSAFVRRSFLDKTHKLLKEHVIPTRFACAFALATYDRDKDLQDDSLKYMAEFIKKYSREARNRKTSKVQGGLITDFPAYIVVYLIHVLAHETKFPSEDYQEDEETYARFCRPLLSVLQALVDPNIVDGDLDLVNEAAQYLVSILRAIKRAKDAVYSQNTHKLHLLADIGLSAMNSFHHNGTSTVHAPGLILLPSSLYSRLDLSSKSEEDKSRHSSQSHLDQNFVGRVIHFFETHFSLPTIVPHERGQKSKGDSASGMVLSTSGTTGTQDKASKREISLGRRRKQAPSSNALELVASESRHPNTKRQNVMATKISEASLEKEQHNSSCGSVRIESSLPNIQVLNKKGDEVTALKENIGLGAAINAQTSKRPVSRPTNPCSSKIRSGSGTESLWLESESLETPSDASLTERDGVLADKSNNIYLQPCGKGFSDGAAQQSKSMLGKTKNLSSKTVPVAAKRKKVARVAGDATLSNTINTSDSTGALRRSQRRRV